MRADEAPSLVIVRLQTREQRARLHHITLPRPPARCLVPAGALPYGTVPDVSQIRLVRVRVLVLNFIFSSKLAEYSTGTVR